MSAARRKKPPKVTTTTTPAPVTTPAQPWGIGAPTGNIPSDLQIAYGRGAPWANVNRHDPYHVKHGNLRGVKPSMLKAMEVVESGGRSIPNGNGFPNYGVMQLTHSWNGGPETKWEAVARRLGMDFGSPEGQIAVAALVLGGHDGDEGTPEEIFLRHYYPVYDQQGNLCLDCKGQDGHTPRQYLSDMHELMRLIDAAEQGVTPVVATEQDLLNLISNDTPGVYVSFGFNELNTGGGDFYRYGKGHGTSGNNMHPGIDVWMPDETPVNVVFGGEVVCVGSQGRVVWDQGCGYFSDDDGGLGNITILTDAFATINGKRYRLKTTYGHMSSAVVRVGQRIADGERIGRSGVANGWSHIHVDVAIEAPELNNPQIWNNPGDYHLVSPLPTMLNALGAGSLPDASVGYPDRLPVPQPDEFDVSVLVTATRDGVPVLQRADLGSPAVNAPLNAGDEFRAVYQVIGNDKRIYWVSTLGSRVPVEGTSAPGWTTAGEGGISLDVAADEVEAVRADVDARLRAVIASLQAA